MPIFKMAGPPEKIAVHNPFCYGFCLCLSPHRAFGRGWGDGTIFFCHRTSTFLNSFDALHHKGVMKGPLGWHSVVCQRQM